MFLIYVAVKLFIINYAAAIEFLIISCVRKFLFE